MTKRGLSLLACQVAIPHTRTARERDQHVARTTREVERRIENDPVDLVVLPELSSVEYSCEAFDHLDLIAEDLHGPSFERWSALAQRHHTTVVFGIPRITQDGYHIAQLAVGPDGNLIGHFDKIHIAHFGASTEKTYFQRANRLFIFEINGVRIAPIICYDIRIPELTRTLCMQHQVDLILHCGAYFRDRTFYSWHSFVITRALENQVFVLSLNRAGDDFGSSVFCPPWVDEESTEQRFGHHEEYRRFTIDLELIEQARSHYTYLSDRLADYDELPYNP